MSADGIWDWTPPNMDRALWDERFEQRGGFPDPMAEWIWPGPDPEPGAPLVIWIAADGSRWHAPHVDYSRGQEIVVAMGERPTMTLTQPVPGPRVWWAPWRRRPAWSITTIELERVDQ